MAVLIPVEDKAYEVHPANQRKFTLEEIKGYIGGESPGKVAFTDTHVMYCDEKGALKELPLNEKAVWMLSQARGLATPIYGDALIVSLEEMGNI